MGKRLKKNIEEAREKDRLQYELQIAREVQLSLLPSKIPEISGFNISASLKTANEVGGDFYDILPLGDDHLLFTIGDVSGKGISAAFYMTLTKGFVKSQGKNILSPKEILIRLLYCNVAYKS